MTWPRSSPPTGARAPVGGAFDVMIDKLEGVDTEMARAMVRDLVADPLFRRHLTGAFPDTDYPVAVLPAALQAALGTRASILRLCDETAAKTARRHAEVTAARYGLVQRAIDRGLVLRQSGGSLVLFVTDRAGRIWRAPVKSASAGRELFLTTLHRSSARQRAAARRRFRVVKDRE